MGYIKHHAIVVTGRSSGIQRAHAYALGLFVNVCKITPITEEGVNGYQTFLVAPDGSKEGWDHSSLAGEKREEFKLWLLSEQEIYVDWVEVVFGGDYKNAKVESHGDQDRYEDEP